jgi:DNA polymerase III subunit epsilon
MTECVREIVFDTETTGLKPDAGDRIIEIGAVELINHIPTGKTLRALINPGRPVSADTVRITGITDADLKDAPGFDAPGVVDALLAFFGDDVIIAHNAGFDRGFLNMELERCGRAPIPVERWRDTAAMARQKFPGAPASLDALCKRFEISLGGRQFHGALLDSQLLAQVYLELIGGRSRAFEFAVTGPVDAQGERAPAKLRPAPLPAALTDAESAAHAAFVDRLRPEAVWKIG